MKDNSSLSEIMNHRIEKLNKIKDANVPAFDYSFKSNVLISQILLNQADWLDKEVKICGRIVSLRKMGKACFIHIQSSNDKIQLLLKQILPSYRPRDFNTIENDSTQYIIKGQA